MRQLHNATRAALVRVLMRVLFQKPHQKYHEGGSTRNIDSRNQDSRAHHEIRGWFDDLPI